MARKSAPRHVEPEDESQDYEQEALEATEPDEEVADEPEAGGDTPNKSQAARAAVDAGYEKPAEAVAYIKKTFGIDMNPQHFSAVKSNYRKAQGAAKQGAKKGEPAKRGRKPREEAPSKGVEGYLAPPPKQAPAGGQPDLLAAMEAMKPLVDSLGKEQVKRIVELLG